MTKGEQIKTEKFLLDKKTCEWHIMEFLSLLSTPSSQNTKVHIRTYIFTY